MLYLLGVICDDDNFYLKACNNEYRVYQRPVRAAAPRGYVGPAAQGSPRVTLSVDLRGGTWKCAVSNPSLTEDESLRITFLKLVYFEHRVLHFQISPWF